MSEKESSAFNTFTNDWSNRIQSVIKLVVLLSGGVMSITIGKFVDGSSAVIPLEAISLIKYAWYALAMSLISSVLIPFVLVISGALVLRDWKKELKKESKRQNLLDVPVFVYVTGFSLLTLSVLGCVVGLGLMAVGAGYALQPLR